MAQHRTSPKPYVLAAASLASLAGIARAQCDYYVWSVPDFDQRRMVTGPIPGLPGNGSMYCAPTSIANWFAYFANAGGPTGFGGPHNWQSNANYNLATNQIALMGALMGTDASNGTGGNGEVAGATSYSLLFGFGSYVVSHEWTSSQNSISPADFWINDLLGGYCGACYGRYNLDSSGHYTRTGGHCITITGVNNACGAGPMYVKFRDPADDSSNTTQSPFNVKTVTVSPVFAHFRGDVGESYTSKTLYRINEYSTPSFFDGLVVVRPAFYIANTAPHIIGVYNVFHFFGSAPPSQMIQLPANLGNLVDVGVPPMMDGYYALTGPGAAVAGQILRFDPMTNAMVPVPGAPTSNAFSRMCFSRFGEMYVLDGRIISQIQVHPDPAMVLGTVVPPGQTDAMDYDDAADELVLVTTPGAGRRAMRYSRDLRTLTANAPLPTGVNLPGVASLAVSPVDGSLWVTSDGATAIYAFRFSAAGGLMQTDMVPLPGTPRPTGLNVTAGGHLVFTGNGMLMELERSPLGGWVPTPNSLFAGQPGGTRICLGRGRTNHDPALHDGPGFYNLPDPEVLPGTIECYANCDQSTTAPILNVNDFQCFVNRYAAGDSYANCDGSTQPPVLNVNDFVCFQNSFASGCP